MKKIMAIAALAACLSFTSQATAETQAKFETLSSGKLASHVDTLYAMYEQNSFLVDKTVKDKKILIHGNAKKVSNRLYTPDGKSFADGKEMPAIDFGKFVGFLDNADDVDLAKIEPGQTVMLSCENVSNVAFIPQGLCKPVIIGTRTEQGINAWYINKELQEFYFGKPE